jgi:hypothetical protein
LYRFAPLVSKRVWEHARVLLIGAILAPGQRTVTSVLHVMGLCHEAHFQNYHRVLNRAVWSTLAARRILLGLLVPAFAPTGALVMGLEDHLERRRGEKSTAKGIYRDPVRSSHAHFVKASGLRWLSMMLLVPIPWAERVWALPFLTALCPSERYHQERGRRHTTLTDRARQMLRVVKCWQPQRDIVVVADRSFAALELLQAVRNTVTVVTRLRLDAALYEPAPERQPGHMGRPRKKGKRLPTRMRLLDTPQIVWRPVYIKNWYGQGPRTVETTTGTAVWYHTGRPVVPIRWVLVRDLQGKFDAQAFLCTDLTVEAHQMLVWFVQWWQVEVTFEEVRAHLGVETQRQWSDKAIARTTPILLGLYSLVTLVAQQMLHAQQMPIRTAAWYAKEHATFSDTLAVVRRRLWNAYHFSRSASEPEVQKVPRSLWERLTDTVCYAA